MAITRRGTQIFKLAADAKPTATSVQAGTELINSDDRKRWVNTGTEWIIQEPPAVLQYNVFKEGTTTYVTDQQAKVQSSNTDTQLAIQPVLDAIPIVTTANFYFDEDRFTMNNPILIPSSTPATTKHIRFFGTFAPSRDAGSCLLASTTFPTNRYFIECNNPVPSAECCFLTVDGLSGANVNFATRNVGFLRLENGDAATRTYNINNIWGQYMWRGIHVIGGVWRSRFTGFTFLDSNAAFVGDADFIMEDGGHTSSSNPAPKMCYIENMITTHGGLLNNGIRISAGSYNNIHDAQLDGNGYTEAVFGLNNTDTLANAFNQFWHCTALDTVMIAAPDNRKGSLYLSGANCVDNTFVGCKFAMYPVSVTIANGAARNTVETVAFWGSTITVVDTGAGDSNTIIVQGGAKFTAGDTKINHTGGLSRIIDRRRGAEKGGIATTRTDGSTIAHGLFAAPAWYHVTGSIAGEIVTATADATNITLAIKKRADGTAGTSQSIAWRAGVYV